MGTRRTASRHLSCFFLFFFFIYFQSFAMWERPRGPCHGLQHQTEKRFLFALGGLHIKNGGLGNVKNKKKFALRRDFTVLISSVRRQPEPRKGKMGKLIPGGSYTVLYRLIISFSTCIPFSNHVVIQRSRDTDYSRLDWKGKRVERGGGGWGSVCVPPPSRIIYLYRDWTHCRKLEGKGCMTRTFAL